MVISFKVSDSTKEKLNEFYADSKREKTPAYASFQANDGDSVVTLYDSGKVVFQGKDADLASDFWIATEKQVNKILTVNNSDNKTKEKKATNATYLYNATTIGSDEVGTGDFFGPIVVSSAYVQKEDIPFLESLGVRDSKKLTDEKILQIVPEIIKKIPYSSIILSNKEYNQKYSTNCNMNKIKAIMHNKVLLNLKEKFSNYDYIVVDQFAQKNVYFSYLKGIPNIVRNITFLTKAEDQVLSVACASLISRFIFLKQFDKLCNELDMFLPKGASDKVDEVGIKIVEKYGESKLNEIAKMNFKNVNKILKKD